MSTGTLPVVSPGFSTVALATLLPVRGAVTVTPEKDGGAVAIENETLKLVIDPARGGTIATPDQEEMLDLPGLDRLHDLRGQRQHRLVVETGREGHARALRKVAYLLCVLNDMGEVLSVRQVLYA